MSSISSISGPSSSSSNGPSVESQIAALGRRIDKTREALEEVASSDMDPQQKETLSASYQSQISVLEAQLQALQQQDAQQQSLSGQTAEATGATTTAQKDALAAKAAESNAAMGTPRSGTSGSIIDIYV